MNLAAAADKVAEQNLAGVEDGRRLPCVFVEHDARCHRLIFLGSSSALVWGSHKVIMIDRKLIHSIQAP
jgi:hypothetical protein